MQEELLLQRMNKISKMKPSLVIGVDEVYEWILQSDPSSRYRINPFHIQAQTGLGLRKVVAILLAGTQTGAFRIHWDLHCPHCNMITDEFHSLSLAKGKSSCKMCEKQYIADFQKRVEVTFSLHPEIEENTSAPVCRTPEKLKPLVEIGLPVGGKETVEIEIPEGQYKYFCPITLAQGRMEVKGERTEEVQNMDIVQLIDGSYDKLQLEFKPGKLKVSFHNPHNPMGGLHLTRNGQSEELDLEDMDIRMTGLELIHIPEFKEFFGSDSLNNKEVMSISSVAILFTDITGSTQMYEELGDVRAYELVREHFDILIETIQSLGGTIVKTIGDAVMASFITSSPAVHSIFKVLEKFESFNAPKDYREHIHIKLGIHEGSAILVNLNDRIDYFGTTVNKAARIQGLADKEHFCLSGEIFEKDSTKEILKSYGVKRVRRSENHSRDSQGIILYTSYRTQLKSKNLDLYLFVHEHV
jgi:class 3 adenylate cyclase